MAAFADDTASTFWGQWSAGALIFRGVGATKPIGMLLFQISPDFGVVA
jgi:hypothetical protein